VATRVKRIPQNKNFEEMINSLDPKYHKHLIESLKSNLKHPQSFHPSVDTNDGVSGDSITEMMKKAMDKLNDIYIPGGVKYIEEFCPVLDKKIDTAEEKVNIKAKAYCEGKIEFEEFRQALKNWYILNLKAIKIHKTETVKNINF